MTGYVLAIDQGTTSSRAIIFDDKYRVVGVGQQEFEQHFPASGWVEHDPEDIWRTVVETSRKAMEVAGLSGPDIAAIGITNQRETVVVWDRQTGVPISNAIVWQDRRTSDMTQAMRDDGLEKLIIRTTGLLLDPYFSASKIAWILNNVDGARKAAENGRLAFGTIDSFLIWHLSGGARHITDATNASRTLLYDIHKSKWSPTMLELFDIPESMMPDVLDCRASFGTTSAELFGAEIPITGVAGDQQAATIGQACFEPGMMKSTYGTGCFAVLNTGDTAVQSSNRLLTTIAYQFDGKPTYALEGSIFVAGAAIQWLRDGLGLLDDTAQSGAMAAGANDTEHVYMVPAFVGLGAPHWDPDCRGAIYGLTRGTGPNEIVKAALESVCFQTLDLLDAMRRDWTGDGDTVLRVDGGMVASDWTMQRLADVLSAPVDRPRMLETTALGAAYLAGSKVDVYGDTSTFADNWQAENRFAPIMTDDIRSDLVEGWRNAVTRTLS